MIISQCNGTVNTSAETSLLTGR